MLLEQLTASPWNNMLFMMYYGLVLEGLNYYAFSYDIIFLLLNFVSLLCYIQVLVICWGITFRCLFYCASNTSTISPKMSELCNLYSVLHWPFTIFSAFSIFTLVICYFQCTKLPQKWGDQCICCCIKNFWLLMNKLYLILFGYDVLWSCRIGCLFSSNNYASL